MVQNQKKKMASASSANDEENAEKSFEENNGWVKQLLEETKSRQTFEIINVATAEDGGTITLKTVGEVPEFPQREHNWLFINDLKEYRAAQARQLNPDDPTENLPRFRSKKDKEARETRRMANFDKAAANINVDEDPTSVKASSTPVSSLNIEADELTQWVQETPASPLNDSEPRVVGATIRVVPPRPFPHLDEPKIISLATPPESPKKKARKDFRLPKQNKKSLNMEVGSLIRDDKDAAEAAAAVGKGEDRPRLRPKEPRQLVKKDEPESVASSSSGVFEQTLTPQALSAGIAEARKLRRWSARPGITDNPIQHEHLGKMHDVKSVLHKEFYADYLHNIAEQYQKNILGGMRKLMTSTSGTKFGFDLKPIKPWPVEVDFFQDEKEDDAKIMQISAIVFKRTRILVKLSQAMSVALLYRVEFAQQKRIATNPATNHALVAKIRRTDIVIKRIQRFQLELEVKGCLTCPERLMQIEGMVEQITLKDSSFD